MYDCWAFPCVNGGFCIDGVDTATCVCPFGFEGVKCERDVNECAGLDMDADPKTDPVLPCDANAECSNIEGRYVCTCRSGYTGDGHLAVDVTDEKYPFGPCVELRSRHWGRRDSRALFGLLCAEWERSPRDANAVRGEISAR